MPESSPGTSRYALAEVAAECDRQDAKWGEQNHLDPTWAAILGEEFGEACQALLHDEFGGRAAGTLRAELIQIAAVAVQWVEAIDRRYDPNEGLAEDFTKGIIRG